MAAASTPNDEDAKTLAIFNQVTLRATAAGFETQYLSYDDDDQVPGQPGFLKVQFPNGRRTRQLTLLSARRAQALLSEDFESFIFLGNFDAYVNSSTGAIEARLGVPSPISRSTRDLWLLPGAEILDKTSDGAQDGSEDLEAVGREMRRPDSWRLRVSSDHRELELSPANSIAFWAQSGVVTLKLTGYESASHDEALAILEKIGNAFLFDLDVSYGASLAIQTRRRPGLPRRQQPSQHAPSFPKNEYAAEALALYEYARTASGLPLLEYLAYYQSIEFFFPMFAREQTVGSVKKLLADPRFSSDDESAINKLINLAAPAVRASLSEREQLRATVRGCTTVDELKAFVESSEPVTEHFCAKKQAIAGAQALRLSGDQSDLRDQVADRVYAIRCRIVHTKQDGGGVGDDMLLPSSSEAESLGAEIDLVRLIAQNALLARASRLV